MIRFFCPNRLVCGIPGFKQASQDEHIQVLDDRYSGDLLDIRKTALAVNPERAAKISCQDQTVHLSDDQLTCKAISEHGPNLVSVQRPNQQRRETAPIIRDLLSSNDSSAPR
jgi:hypothetical protein